MYAIILRENDEVKVLGFVTNLEELEAVVNYWGRDFWEEHCQNISAELAG